jgi:hypothetical protein
MAYVWFCAKQISTLQRRTIQVCGGCVALLAFIELIWLDLARHDPPILLVSLFALLPTLPLIAIVNAISRYLKRETDEFIRALVVASLLWSFGVIMVADTILGVILRNTPGMRILPMLNIDLFCSVTPIALRIQLWRSR